jgi:hypothetical protein
VVSNERYFFKDVPMGVSFQIYAAHVQLTINAPLILKDRDVIFFLRAKHIMGQFAGFFEGAETFLTPKLS